MDAPRRIIGYLALLLMLSFIAGCSGGDADLILTDEDLDIEPFIEYAEAADCADDRNRLFIIDIEDEALDLDDSHVVEEVDF